LPSTKIASKILRVCITRLMSYIGKGRLKLRLQNSSMRGMYLTSRKLRKESMDSFCLAGATLMAFMSWTSLHLSSQFSQYDFHCHPSSS